MKVKYQFEHENFPVSRTTEIFRPNYLISQQLWISRARSEPVPAARIFFRYSFSRDSWNFSPLRFIKFRRRSNRSCAQNNFLFHFQTAKFAVEQYSLNFSEVLKREYNFRDWRNVFSRLGGSRESGNSEPVSFSSVVHASSSNLNIYSQQITPTSF